LRREWTSRHSCSRPPRRTCNRNHLDHHHRYYHRHLTRILYYSVLRVHLSRPPIRHPPLIVIRHRSTFLPKNLLLNRPNRMDHLMEGMPSPIQPLHTFSTLRIHLPPAIHPYLSRNFVNYHPSRYRTSPCPILSPQLSPAPAATTFTLVSTALRRCFLLVKQSS